MTRSLGVSDGVLVLGPVAGEEAAPGPCGKPLEADLPPAEPVRNLSAEMLVMVSTARAGSSVPELLDGSTSTFWQSDGAAPHSLDVQFYRRQTVAEVALQLDFSADESYTPQEITLRAGNTLAELHDLRRITLDQPVGWVRVPFVARDKRGLPRYLRAHVLQISISANHQAGRDCHVRQLCVLGPLLEPRLGSAMLPAAAPQARAAAPAPGPARTKGARPLDLAAHASGLFDGIR